MPEPQGEPTASETTAVPVPAPTGTASAEARPNYTDVWSWTARKYRIRAIVLLVINFGLFCSLCSFTHWLHVGRPLEFSWQSYFEPARFWGEQSQSLYDFVLFPISVDETPVHGVVIGLLFASVVAIPISVAMVYRFRCSLPFALAVLVFAHMPWMAITLVGSCILAAVKPFRMKFRYGSALVALIPVALYLVNALRHTNDPLSASISPERKLLLISPWLLAVLGASIMLAAVILIARIVNYRPGPVAPVMAVMFAIPLLLFFSYGGADELSYRILESEYGPRSRRFEPVQDASSRILQFVHERTEHGADTAAQAIVRALWSGGPTEATEFKHRISNHMQVELLKDRQAADVACWDFISGHLRSRYIPNVLFIQASALDTRLDELQFLAGNAQRRLYNDFPHVRSEGIWTNLLTHHPNSPLAIAARLRVAQLRLRRGEARGALQALRDPAPPASPVASQPTGAALLSGRPPESSLDFDPEPYLFEIRRLRELIDANVYDPAEAEEIAPLRALASLDPHRTGYRDQLQRLAHEYREHPLHPNLVVLWAETHPDLAQRETLLRSCVERFADDDALPEALFRLADLEVQSRADGAGRAEGLARLRQITEHFAHTCWAAPAAERLRIFGGQTEPAGAHMESE